MLPDLKQSKFPQAPEDGYDLIVIGSGPGGEACAVRAAQLGMRVAIIEQKAMFGGPTGLTSKAVREATKRICKAVDQIGGDRRRQVKGLWKRSFPILKTEAEAYQVYETRDKLQKNGVDLFIGTTEFINTSNSIEENAGKSTTLRICRPSECIDISTKHVCIATGSRPTRPETLSPDGPDLPFSKTNRILTATEMGQLKELPNAVAIIGGGVIAVEYATVLAELGVGVSLLCPEADFMPFLEAELRDKLKRRMKSGHVLFVHECIKEIVVGNNDDPLKVVLEPRVLPSKMTVSHTRILPERRLTVDLLLYSGGRDANSEGLGLENIGVKIGKYGRIVVNNQYQCTSSDNNRYSVFAIGDVIGSGLASAAQQQGRMVAEDLFGQFTDEPDFSGKMYSGEDSGMGELEIESDAFFSVAGEMSGDEAGATLFGGNSPDSPLTLWTIPEIATVGMTLSQAQESCQHQDAVSIVEGYGYYRDMARGRLSGDMDGYLKVTAWRKGMARHHTIIGVQILGEGANELIQLGSVLVHAKATLEQISRTPFAAVTLSALYQMACDDAILQAKSKATY